MTLFTEHVFLTTDQEGFKICRETRSSNTATMTVLFCEEGFIDVYYHEKMQRIKAGELFVRIPDFHHPLGPYEMSPDFKFYQVTVDATVFDKIMFAHMRVEPNWYIKQEYIKEHPTFELSERGKDVFFSYFHLLEMHLRDRQTDYRKQILMLTARAATMEMLNYMDNLAVIAHYDYSKRVATNQSDYTFREFTRLLYTHPHQREVKWYAEQLEITPKYLSEICKERSGLSASDWITKVTVSEIKHYLRDTALPIHEIAMAMEFPNASFFCQYTKKHTGLTPNHFRKKPEE